MADFGSAFYNADRFYVTYRDPRTCFDFFGNQFTEALSQNKGRLMISGSGLDTPEVTYLAGLGLLPGGKADIADASLGISPEALYSKEWWMAVQPHFQFVNGDAKHKDALQYVRTCAGFDPAQPAHRNSLQRTVVKQIFKDHKPDLINLNSAQRKAALQFEILQPEIAAATQESRLSALPMDLLGTVFNTPIPPLHCPAKSTGVIIDYAGPYYGNTSTRLETALEYDRIQPAGGYLFLAGWNLATGLQYFFRNYEVVKKEKSKERIEHFILHKRP